MGAGATSTIANIETGSQTADDKLGNVKNLCNKDRRRLTGGFLGGSFTAPAAFASILCKIDTTTGCSGSSEKVLTFQGTKLDEPEMLLYSALKTPVMFGGIVTTEGYAMYLTQLYDCVVNAASENPPNYITGHSLGGAAATLFSLLTNSGALVTFGAPPMTITDYTQDTLLKGEYVLGADLWNPDAIPETKILKNKETGAPMLVETSSKAWKPLKWSGPFDLPNGLIPGTRYFHKFDPVPGYYFNPGGWDHVVSSAIMLYDSDDACTEPTFAFGQHASGDDFEGISALYSHLCTDAEIKTNTWSAPSAYYSYSNAVNPAPCAEAAAGAALEYIATTTSITVPTDGYWVPQESFETCAYTYMATIEAYAATWFYSALLGQEGIEQREPYFWLAFYTMWGLWVDPRLLPELQD